MQGRLSALGAACVAAAMLGTVARAGASSFSAVLAYGDSLSDNGNLYKLVGQPGAPYYGGRASNGPVAVEQLAAQLGAPLLDFAFDGATTGIGNELDGGTQTAQGYAKLPGMALELAGSSALLNPTLLRSGLFVVWGGADDYLVGGSAAVAAAGIVGIVNTLKGEGAQHILVPGLPDLGLTPDYFGVASATMFSQQFNASLQTGLPSGATYADTFSLLHSIDADPAAYGFTDVTDPCLNAATGTLCANPNQYLFWDGFHPTTAADAIVANEFVGAVTPAAAASTPEPSSWVLMGSGVAGLLGVVRRRRWRVGGV